MAKTKEKNREGRKSTSASDSTSARLTHGMRKICMRAFRTSLLESTGAERRIPRPIQHRLGQNETRNTRSLAGNTRHEHPTLSGIDIDIVIGNDIDTNVIGIDIGTYRLRHDHDYDNDTDALRTTTTTTARMRYGHYVRTATRKTGASSSSPSS